MSQLSDEEILNRIESSGANEHQPADALAEILQQFRNERAAPDSRFQQELEKSLLARQTAEPAKQNLFMLVWRNVNMRKITYAAVPSLALLVIAAIIINPFANRFNSEDFLQKAYANNEPQGSGSIHYQKTRYLPGADEAAFNEIMFAQVPAAATVDAGGEALPEITISAGAGIVGMQTQDMINEMWSDDAGNFMYISTDPESGEVLDGHLSRMNADGTPEAWFRTDSPFGYSDGGVATSYVVGDTNQSNEAGMVSAGVIGGTGEIGLSAGGTPPELTVSTGPVVGSVGMINVSGVTTSNMIVSSSGTVSTTPNSDQPIEEVTICIGATQMSDQDQASLEAWTQATDKFYQQLDQLHSEKNAGTIQAILEELKANDQLAYEGTQQIDGIAYHVFRVQYPEMPLPQGMIPSDFTMGSRLYFDPDTYRLSREEQTAEYEEKTYSLSQTVFLEDSWLDADPDTIFNPDRYDLKKAEINLDAGNIVMIDTADLPADSGCFELQGETWVQIDEAQALPPENE